MQAAWALAEQRQETVTEALITRLCDRSAAVPPLWPGRWAGAQPIRWSHRC
jgi:hypothetical protein